MGLGDQLLGTGLAKGAKARGKRIAFGNGKQILWDHHSEQVFRNNPNIAPLGSEGQADIEWIPFYRGNRIYNRQGKDCWIWNYEFKAIPGEVYFTEQELQFGKWAAKGMIVIEPNVPEFKSCAPNKQWPVGRYQDVARKLVSRGFDVIQFSGTGRNHLTGVRQVKMPTFRHAVAALKYAKLYIGPEGGLHHAAAAVGCPAVVLFGGFIPPQVTGYEGHVNLTGGAEACGKLSKCEHCEKAMNKIGVEEVLNAASSFCSATGTDAISLTTT